MNMVSRFAIPTLAALTVLTVTPAAHAADLPPAPPVMVAPEVGGWYLRGDIGFSNQNVGSLFSADYASFTSVTNVNKAFDAAPLFGLGIGYAVNNWLRFDMTGEYRSAANFHGFDIGALPSGGFSADRYTGSKSEWTFLFNGYVDLGTWQHITPFVGAGVGFSRNTISNFGDFSTCINSLSCAGNGGSDANGAADSTWNFAWALYAGLAYNVTRNFTVELAYRYIDLGNATTGTVTTFAGTCGCTPMEFNHLTSQDLKLGLRFNLDSFYEAPSPVPYYPPLHSKG
jgi:opacity protein-like surface antigen